MMEFGRGKAECGMMKHTGKVYIAQKTKVGELVVWLKS